MRDGLDALREQLDIKTTMRLIEQTAQWVDRETFEYLPVWFPEEARRDLMYKKNWSEPQYNTNRRTGEKIHKRVGNVGANKALTMALGLRSSERPNWTCCHIWGIDDPTYQISNSVASDKKYYSCVANMILLPTPLKAFTDVMQDVKDMLRISAAYYYNWTPDNHDVPALSEIEARCHWSNYPESWPTEIKKIEPKGVVKFNRKIKDSVDRRKLAIQNLLENAGSHFPRSEVIDVLRFWKIDVSGVAS